MVLKRGALTQEELLDIWKGSVDSEFARPLLEAGEGHGLEVHTQAHAQLARVSKAIERTTQAMYIRPWSGQTEPPASGEKKARVRLQFTRTTRFEVPLWFRKGEMIVAHVENDWGENGSREVRTGLRYVLDEDVLFEPGEAGPVVVWALAEQPGFSYNWPFEGTIRAIEQIGAGLENVNATVASTAAGAMLVKTPNRPDTFVPANVGSYVSFIGGANNLRVIRIGAFEGPDMTAAPPIGSTVQLDRLVVIGVTSISGTLNVGDIITGTLGPVAKVLRVHAVPGGFNITALVTFWPGPGGYDPGSNHSSNAGASFTVATLLHVDQLTNIVAGQTWRVVTWGELGVHVENLTQPSGGALGMLDMLGKERGMPRHTGESDEDYSLRIWKIPDAVSPNAILRILWRLLGALDWCFQEAGEELRGFFYDGDNSGPHTTPTASPNDAYDAVVAKFTVTGLLHAVGDEVYVTDPTGTIRYARGVVTSIAAFPTLITTVSLRYGVPPTTGGLVRVGFSTLSMDPYTSVTLPPGGQTRKNRTYLDTVQFRGFFQVCVPRLSIGEKGVAFDAGAHNAFDVAPDVNLVTTFDGGPVGNAEVYGNIWREIDRAHAAGVSYTLALDCETC